MARALMQRWNLGEEKRNEIIDVLYSIAKDVSNSPRERTSAAKALMAAEKQNQEDEHKIIDVQLQQRNARLDAIADELGLEVGFIEDVSRKSGSGFVPPADV